MEKLSPIIELLRADGSIVVNKRLAKAIGLREAVLYSELISRYIYFKSKAMLSDQGYFFNTIKDLEDGTTITRRHQDAAIKNLVKHGLIKVKLAGVPAKRYFRIQNDPEAIMALLGGAEKDIVKKRTVAIVEAFRKAGAEEELDPETERRIEAAVRDGMRKQGEKSKWIQQA